MRHVDRLAKLIEESKYGILIAGCSDSMPDILDSYFNGKNGIPSANENKICKEKVERVLREIKLSALENPARVQGDAPRDCLEDFAFADAILSYYAPSTLGKELKEYLTDDQGTFVKKVYEKGGRGTIADAPMLRSIAKNPDLYLFIIGKIVTSS